MKGGICRTGANRGNNLTGLGDNKQRDMQHILLLDGGTVQVMQTWEDTGRKSFSEQGVHNLLPGANISHPLRIVTSFLTSAGVSRSFQNMGQFKKLSS